MRYILICETRFPSTLHPGAALHTKHVTRDELVRLIGTRWTNIERTLSIVEAAADEAKGKHFGVPIDAAMGRYTLQVEGKMDYETRRYRLPCPACSTQGKPCAHRVPLEWVDPDHVCSPACMLQPYRRVSQVIFAAR